jgi:hypothetical protein
MNHMSKPHGWFAKYFGPIKSSGLMNSSLLANHPIQFIQSQEVTMFFFVPGLVICHITNWKDPPCFQWVNQQQTDWAMASS